MDKNEVNYVKIRPKTLVDVSRIVTIHYFEFGPHFVYEGEKHDFWEMVYIDKGSVEIERDGQKIELHQGEVVFHKPNEFHAIRSKNSSPNFFVISFECRSIAMKYFERYSTELDVRLKDYISSIVKEGQKTYVFSDHSRKLLRKGDAPLGGEQLIKTYLEQMLIFMLRSITKKGSIKAILPEADTNQHPIVSAVIAYLNERVEENIRVNDICDEFGYSRSFMNKLFQTHTGDSMAAYFVKLKIDKAKSFIRETNMNFAQISAKLSFENPQYFSRVFKRLTGMTPSEFKKRALV